MDKSELKSIGGPGHQRARQYYEIYFQEFDQIPTVNIREKSPLASGRRRKKESFKICPSILLFLTRPDF